MGTRWARVRPSADPPAYAECRDHSATQAVRVSSGSSREGEMRSYAQHRIQGDLRAGIEQMVNRGVDLRAVAVKRFPRPVHTMSYLVVAVGKASPGHTDSQVGVFSQKSPDAQLAVDKRRGHRQPQRQVRLQKPRHVAVIKRICRERRVPCRPVIAILIARGRTDQPALGLPDAQQAADTRHPQKTARTHVTFNPRGPTPSALTFLASLRRHRSRWNRPL